MKCRNYPNVIHCFLETSTMQEKLCEISCGEVEVAPASTLATYTLTQSNVPFSERRFDFGLLATVDTAVSECTS